MLFNVKISNNRFFTHQRPNLKEFCRSDIFKYSIASHASLNKFVSKYIFFIKLDNDLEDKKDEIERFIFQSIDKDKLHLFWHRNNTISDWREHSNIWNDIDDDIIWFSGNDDHIFFDYDLEMVESSLNILEPEKDIFSSVYFSHWPEAMRMAFKYNAELHHTKDFVYFDWQNHDSIRILTKKLFNHYWFGTTAKTDDIGFYRTDVFNFLEEGKFPIKTFVPTREMCRHFDGYSHVGGLFDYFPPLEIPNGFFESNMTVNYGHEKIDKNAININPKGEFLKCSCPETGYDMWATLDKLPLFWKGKISEVNSNNIDDSFEENYKNKMLKSLRQRVDCYCTTFRDDYNPPEEWILKHLP